MPRRSWTGYIGRTGSRSLSLDADGRLNRGSTAATPPPLPRVRDFGVSPICPALLHPGRGAGKDERPWPREPRRAVDGDRAGGGLAEGGDERAVAVLRVCRVRPSRDRRTRGAGPRDRAAGG